MRERASAGYRLVRAFVRLLLWLFFRRIDVVGRDRVPDDAPLVIAANHHNALVDAMLIIANVERPVHILAKAPLFRHPLIAPFLRVIGAVPVHRRVDAGDDPAKNAEMFRAAVTALHAGGALLIFPEGTSQPQPTLLPVRTGAARIVLDAERAAASSTATSTETHASVVLLPLGMVFHDPGTFRSASVQINVGNPVVTGPSIALHVTDPAAAVRRLTAELSDAIRARIVEADDQYTLALLDAAAAAWSDEVETARIAGDAEALLAWKRAAMRAARYLRDHEPARFAALRQRIELYRAHLDAVGLRSSQLGRPYTARGVVSYVAENVVWLALGLPLAWFGFVVHAIPYWATALVAPRVGESADEEATDKIAVGVVFYPLAWIAEAWLVARLCGLGWTLVFVALLVPSGLLALAWRERVGHVARQAHAFVSFLFDRSLHRHLLDERRALADELRRLAALVPAHAR